MTKKAEAESPKLAGMKYLVTAVVAAGERTTVMQITDQNSGGRRFALRVIKRESPADDLPIARAQAESVVSAKCGHPSVLRNYDFRLRRSWFKVTRAELLMEFVEGKTIDAIEKIPIASAILIFHNAAAAVAHMHRRGASHGDLRPSQIMLSRTGHVKVRGYGLTLVPVNLRVLVKPNGNYSAPEQSREKVVNERTEVYAFGATMYHVLTGKTAGGIPRSEGEKIATPSALNVKVPSILNDLVIHCLQLKPDRRPADMYEVTNRLEAMVKSMKVDEASLAGLAVDSA